MKLSNMNRLRQCQSPQRIGGLLLAALAAVSASAESVAAEATPGMRVIDSASVEHWADRRFEEALGRNEFSGLVVSVVRDGSLIFAKGYGRADFAVPGPVDAALTQFRIGSITKTFTASLLAKLIEDGRIASLDEPANRYLRDYTLPANRGVAITLHHLVTHTAGFEDRFYAIGSDSPVPARLSAREFDRLRPAYVRPAGSRVEYSNFGLAVVGRVIEDVTGLTIDEAMRTMLFEPLGMTHTRLLVDITEPEGLGRPATILADGTRRATPFTAINPAVAAAGSIVSTGEDMARYMVAQLRASHEDAARPAVLSERALQLLHTRRAGNAPETTGVGMVFFDEQWGNQRTVAHGGNWEGFHSWMTLIPEHDTGIFIGVMSEPPLPTPFDAIRGLLAPGSVPLPSPAVATASGYINDFLLEFLGERRPLPNGNAGPAAGDLRGWYRLDRRVFSSAESVADLFAIGGTVLRVDAGDGQELSVGGAGPWRTAGDGVFVLDAPIRNRVVIRQDPRVGAPVLIPDLGIYTFTRIPGYLHPRLHAYVVLTALVVSLVAWLVLLRSTGRVPRVAIASASATTLFAWALPVVGFAGLYGGKSMLEMLYAGHQFPLALFVVLSNLMAAAALVTFGAAFASGTAQRTARSAMYVVSGAGVAISLVLACYNVLGWQLPA